MLLEPLGISPSTTAPRLYLNAKELAESLGFVTVPYEKKSKGITIKGVNFIFYNEKERFERQHYSIAHELLERHLINENLNQLKSGNFNKKEIVVNGRDRSLLQTNFYVVNQHQRK